MVLKYELFNESKLNKLTKELLEDYFLSFIDTKQLFTVDYYINFKSVGGQWEDIETGIDDDVMPVERVALAVNINLFLNDDKFENSLPRFNRYTRWISDINSTCNRIDKHYDTNIIINIDKVDGRDADKAEIIFEYKPTLFDACYISYYFISDYFDSELNWSSEFISKDNTFYIEITPIANKNLSLELFKVELKKFLNTNYNKYKIKSIKKINNKFLIEEFISLDDIKFKF